MADTSLLPVLIVGAGPAGLCTALELQKRGVPARILEAGDAPGTSFARMRPGLSLVSPKWFCQLPGLPLPDGSPDYLPMGEYAVYLRRYAQTNALDIRTSTRVIEARREAGHYQLLDDRGEIHRAQVLVAATGIYSNPHWPQGFDPATSGIPAIHSVDYQSADAFRGLNVLVVGAGLSAQEIALELEPVARVTLSLRRPAQFVPNPILGVDVAYLAFLPEKIPVRWLPWLVPTREPFTGAPIRDALRSGRIRTRPGFINVHAGGHGAEVEFADGSSEPFDRIIFATGFFPTVSWLKDLCATRGLLLDRVTDGTSQDHPGLYFVGFPFERTFGSRFLRGLRKDAGVIAGAIEEYLAGFPTTQEQPEDGLAIKLKAPRPWLDTSGRFLKPGFGECLREALTNINVLSDRRRLPTFMMMTGFALCGPLLTLIYLWRYLSLHTIPIYLVYSWIYIVWTNTIYWHRFACHRAFRPGPVLGRILRLSTPVFMPVENYVLPHLVHHARPDRPGDPYTPRLGFWGCLFTEWTTGVLDGDAMSDEDVAKTHRLLEHIGMPLNHLEGFRRWGTFQTWGSLFGDFALATALHAGFLYAAGGAGWVLAMYAALFVNHFFNLEFNYSAHGSGFVRHRPWDRHRGDLSINQWGPGLLGGEWHNNHHLFPRSMRSGFLPGQLDIPFQLVRLMKSCGLVESYVDQREAFLARPDDDHLPPDASGTSR